ncbi:MAG: acyltransferase [Wenzhouxiangellaceae bacterium]|nr:acyltransferase [Wenzhouxiangellaceae bacterium]
MHGLRGIAALAVLLFHWNGYFPALHEEYARVELFGITWNLFRQIHFGWVGVLLFFVLSGYLLGGQLIEKNLDARTLSRYWARRFLRIYPAAWFQLAILLAVAGLVPGLIATVSWPDLARNFSLWINMPPSMTEPLNGVWWTLPIELSFYIILPAVVLLQRRFGWLTMLVACILITLGWRAVVMHVYSGHNLANVQAVLDALPGSLTAFAFGFAINFVTLNWSTRARFAGLVASVGIYLAMQQWLLANLESYWTGHWMLAVWNPAMGGVVALVVLFILSHDSFSRPFSNRPLVWLGEISFGVYLWHYPVLKVLDIGFGEVWTTPALSAMALAICLVLTLMLAAISYYMIERPVMGWGKQSLARAPLAPVSSASSA